MLVFLIAAGLPDDHDILELKESEFWRVILGFPIALYVIVFFGTLFVVRHETPKFLIIKKKYDLAILAIKDIYEPQQDP
jgi:hypothetical protein